MDKQVQAGLLRVVATVEIDIDDGLRMGAAWNLIAYDLPIGKYELITLQAHREAMAELEEMNSQLREQNESVDAACAKLEAALQACVEALKNSTPQAEAHTDEARDVAQRRHDAAITQAQEALK